MTPLGPRTAAAVLAIATLVACAAASPATASGEPQITAAGIDAQDRVVVTWQLAQGTTFYSMDVETSPILDHTYPAEPADLDGLADIACTPPPPACKGVPTQTSYRGSVALSRDRRYFVKVTAQGPDDEVLNSAMWVLDESKPLIPGAPKRSQSPTNMPVSGRPYVAPAPGTIPPPKLALLAPIPKTIAGFLRRGLRARLSCPVFECHVAIEIVLGDTTEVLESATVRPGGRRTFALRLGSLLREELRKRSRARLRLDIDVTHPGGKYTEIVRRISLRR